jgi:hypothetical protein
MLFALAGFDGQAECRCGFARSGALLSPATVLSCGRDAPRAWLVACFGLPFNSCGAKIVVPLNLFDHLLMKSPVNGEMGPSAKGIEPVLELALRSHELQNVINAPSTASC